MVNWIRLLKGLEGIDPVLEIFTTNYDLVLEDAIKQAEIKVNLGLAPDYRRMTLDMTPWHTPPALGSDPMFTKLHGSVNWQHDNGNITISTPRFTEDHDNHCILYPGYKGTPTEEPFSVFHTRLQRVVRGEHGSLTAAVFIGFAFRDNHINSILDDLPSKPLKYVITKSDGKHIDAKPPENAPASFRDNCLHRRDGLTIEATESCLENITASMEGKPRRVRIKQD